MELPFGVSSKTLVADDESSLLTSLGPLRRPCAGHNLREDMRAFLDALEAYADDLAIYLDPSGPKLVRDDNDRLLQWVERKGEAG